MDSDNNNTELNNESTQDGGVDGSNSFAVDDFKKVQMATAPYDPRFPHTNVGRHCWQYYVDYHKCIRAKGNDFPPCLKFKRIYEIMCPASWVEKWNDAIAEGVFSGDTTPPEL